MTVPVNRFRLTRTLARRQLSIRRAAALAGVPESSLRRLCREERPSCRAELLDAVASVLGVSHAWLRRAR